MRPPSPAAEATAEMLDALLAQVEHGPLPSREQLAGALESLRTSLEELRVAEERLLEQNDEIATAHVALAAERRRYRELFDLAPDAYVVTDEAGVIVEANRSAAALLGVAQQFLIRKPLATFVAPGRRREFRKLLQQVDRLDATAPVELRLQRRTGVPVDVAMTVATIRRSHTDTAIGIRWLARDVSEQKQAEERLWELNAELEQRVVERTAEAAADAQLLNAVLEQVPLGVVVADAPFGRLRIVNARARELMASPSGVPGTLEEFERLRVFRPDGSPCDPDELPLARAVRDGATVIGELLVRELGDGSRPILSVTAYPVRNAAGATVAAVSLIEDVSDRERRQRAERDFAANAAHELRTPVASIVSAIEVLQGGAKEVAEERDLFLGHIERESGRLQRLTRALLLLARSDAEGERPRVTVVPLKRLLEDAAASIVTAPGVGLSVRCRRDLAVLAAPDLLEQALANVLGNAARYTESGAITVHARADGKDAVIVVQDTGRGMDRAEEALVFGRFYRGGPRDSQGFGLGLPIARHAVEASGGTIALASAPGSGTTVTIRMPLARLVRT